MLSMISTPDLIVFLCASAIVVAFVFILRRFIRNAENDETGH